MNYMDTVGDFVAVGIAVTVMFYIHLSICIRYLYVAHAKPVLYFSNAEVCVATPYALGHA